MRPGFTDLLPLSGEISSDRPYSWLDCQSSDECVSLERDDQQVLRLAYNFELTGIRRFLSRESLRNVFLSTCCSTRFTISRIPWRVAPVAGLYGV